MHNAEIINARHHKSRDFIKVHVFFNDHYTYEHMLPVISTKNNHIQRIIVTQFLFTAKLKFLV